MAVTVAVLALAHSLGAEDGAVRGGGCAGLDVFVDEPLPPDSPLRTLPRSVLSPHLGHVTDTTYRLFHGQAVEDVTALLSGRPVRVLGTLWQGRPRRGRTDLPTLDGASRHGDHDDRRP